MHFLCLTCIMARTEWAINTATTIFNGYKWSHEPRQINRLLPSFQSLSYMGNLWSEQPADWSIYIPPHAKPSGQSQHRTTNSAALASSYHETRFIPLVVIAAAAGHRAAHLHQRLQGSKVGRASEKRRRCSVDRTQEATVDGAAQCRWCGSIGIANARWVQEACSPRPQPTAQLDNLTPEWLRA